MFNYKSWYHIDQIINNYNTYPEVENGEWAYQTDFFIYYYAYYDCTVKDILTDTYGKFSNANDELIIFEYKSFFLYQLNLMCDEYSGFCTDDFRKWIHSKE